MEENPGGCSNSYTGYYTPQAHLSAPEGQAAGGYNATSIYHATMLVL